MSEIRVDNILSADGTAAPVYSKGINVAAGQTLTNAGDFVTSGKATFNSGAEIVGVTTFHSGFNNINFTGITTFSGGATVTGVTTFNSALDNVNFTGISTFNNNVKFQEGLNVTGVVTFTDLSIQSGVTTFSGNVSVGGTLTYEDVTSVDSLGIVTARTGVKVTAGGVDVTAGGINVAGVSTLGGNLNIGGNAQFTVASPQLEFNNGGPRLWSPSANTLSIHSGGGFGSTNNERLRITSGGHVNIGGEYAQTDAKTWIQDSSRPIAEATLNLASSATNGAVDTGPVLRFYGHDGTTARYHASIKGAKENGTSGNRAGYLALNTRPDGGSMLERFRIGSAGQFGIGGATYGSSGQVLTSGGASAAPTWAAAGGGKVVQVKQSHTTNQVDSTTANHDLISCTITPTAATSNILVMTSFFYGGNMNPNGGFRFTRGGTVCEGSAASSQYGGSTGCWWTWDDCGGTTHSMEAGSFNWLDTGPSGNGVNTTSAVTYKLEAHSFTRLLFNRAESSGGGTSTLILMEIAA